MTSGTHANEEEAGGVAFFDGTCVLCNRSMRFLIGRDRHRRLRFAPLQGKTFERVRAAVDLPDGLDSLVYVREIDAQRPHVFVHSNAVLHALRDIGGFWRAVSWLRVVPRPLRDAVYRWIARHRYRWFGRYDTCRLPTAEERGRLLP